MASADKWGLTDPRMQGFVARYERAWKDPHGPDLKEFWTEDAEVFTAGSDEPVRGAANASAMVDAFLGVAPDIGMEVIDAAENISRNLLYIQFKCHGTFKGQGYVEWVAVDRFEFGPTGDRSIRGYSFFSPPEAIAAFQ
jgi:hypothetical protein